MPSFVCGASHLQRCCAGVNTLALSHAQLTVVGMSGSELLDVFSSEGVQKGVMRRSAAHASLEWHQTFHCWVVAERPYGLVLLAQRRRKTKSRPGLLDASAGGHIRAGETIEEASREIEEELGSHIEFSTLSPLGVFAISHGQPGCDNEFANLFAFKDDRPLRDWTFDRHEAQGLLEVPFAGLSASRSSGEHFLAIEMAGNVVKTATVSFGSFSPFSDPYWDALLGFAQRSALRTSS